MKNMTNALNKLTKLLAVAIISVSLNAFSVVLDPLITISTNHVSAGVSPPLPGSPHAVIVPLALTAAKALPVE
jgi:hypothetical protein